MKVKFYLFILLFFNSFFLSGNSDNKNLFEKHVYIHGKDTLPYRLLKPLNQEAGKLYPLVIFLHGSGERGNDNEKQLVHGVSLFADSIEKYPCFVVIPQCPEGKRWVEADWSLPNPIQPDQISLPLDLTLKLTDSILMSFLPVDIKRIYITGLSMGGKGTWDLMYRFPTKFAAAIPVCGSADIKIASKIKHIPVWTFHGDKDEVVPFIATKNLVNALQDAGGNPLFTVLKDVGHNAWDYAYTNTELLHWLFSKSK